MRGCMVAWREALLPSCGGEFEVGIRGDPWGTTCAFGCAQARNCAVVDSFVALLTTPHYVWPSSTVLIMPFSSNSSNSYSVLLHHETMLKHILTHTVAYIEQRHTTSADTQGPIKTPTLGGGLFVGHIEYHMCVHYNGVQQWCGTNSSRNDLLGGKPTIMKT